MKTNVQATSIAAYHTHAGKQKEVERFARFVLEKTKAGQRVFDKMLKREIGMDANLASARRNEIEKAGYIFLDGAKYRLIDTGKAKDPITRKKVNTYQLTLWADSPQLELF